MYKEDSLADEPFSYRVFKDGRLELSFHHSPVVVVSGVDASRLLARLEAGSAEQNQQAMARATGNFKRGNEREAKQRRKR